MWLKTIIYCAQRFCGLEIKTGHIDLSLLHVRWGLSWEDSVAKCDLRAVAGILWKRHHSPVRVDIGCWFHSSWAVRWSSWMYLGFLTAWLHQGSWASSYTALERNECPSKQGRSWATFYDLISEFPQYCFSLHSIGYKQGTTVGPDSREGAIDSSHLMGEKFVGMFRQHCNAEVVIWMVAECHLTDHLISQRKTHNFTMEVGQMLP